MTARTDVTEALHPFRGHLFYPQACGAVLAEKRANGVHAALSKAKRIADAMADRAIERRLNNA